MNRTKIEWVKNPDGTQGYTWNPITGCLNHDNGLCKGGGFPCYAYKLANGRLKYRYMMGLAKDRIPVGDNYKLLRDPFCPHFWEERLTPLHTPRKADSPKKGIFVCDMGELFGDWIPSPWQAQIFQTINDNPQHRFYLLTKQPQNLIKFSPFPENCWVGVTVCNEAMLSIASNYMTRIKARVKFYSFEPLLKWDFKAGWDKENMCLIRRFKRIDWIIIGAQTKPYKPPKIAWIQEIIEAADQAGVKVFLKDNLIPLLSQSPDKSKIIWAYADTGLRQEMP